MPDPRKQVGESGERLAAEFLKDRGFLIEAMNVRTPFGEIDLVCRFRDEWVFVEVKTREDREYGYPEEAITPTKFLHMARSAEAYLQEQSLESVAWRLDVVAIRMTPNQDPEILHFEAVQGPHGR